MQGVGLCTGGGGTARGRQPLPALCQPPAKASGSHIRAWKHPRNKGQAWWYTCWPSPIELLPCVTGMAEAVQQMCLAAMHGLTCVHAGHKLIQANPCMPSQSRPGLSFVRLHLLMIPCR